ncbi:hypothetical protein L0Y65_05045 [Candidatus Micrarchaeota archaeon]|nr:hypothetical protein [Candidatus Micrarchaeota archaeon]
MRTPDKALTGIAPKEEQAPARKPFAGRTALISGLIDAHREEASGVASSLSPAFQFDQQSRASAQIVQSRRIFEAVLDIAQSRAAIGKFRRELLTHAQSIADKRRDAQTKIGAPAPCPARPGKPATMKDALVMAFEDMGLDARIIAEKELNGRALFSAETGGQTFKVPINSSALELDDPVAKVKVILSFVLGVSEEERRKQSMAQRRSTRPAATPLGIGERELDGRMVTYDGQLADGKAGQWLFTYTARGLETTFSISSEARGADLLDAIDEKIDMAHRQYGQPYPAAVLEWRAMGRAGKRYLDGVTGDLHGIACTLDYLATFPARMRELIPQEYREGFDALKKLPPPHAAFLKGQEMEELRGALDSLGHPIHAIILESYGTQDGKPGRVAVEQAESLLKLAPSDALEVCDGAIDNVAEAYCLVSRESRTALQDAAENRKNYYRMIFSVRKAINEAVADGSLEVDS